MDKQQVIYKDLGMVSYKDAWDYQESLLQKVVEQKAISRKNEQGCDVHLLPAEHHLLFCEHEPVYTLGKSGSMSNVLLSEEELQQKGINFFKTNRGGDITFHGPEQLVGYPIFDLEKFKTDIGWYLRTLEEAIILTIAEYGIKGDRSAGETGVWLDPQLQGKERKIAAIGVRCSRWVTMHGFALNVNTDLSYFNYIIPCGIQNKQVTSIQKELGFKVDVLEVKQKMLVHMAALYNLSIVKEGSAAR